MRLAAARLYVVVTTRDALWSADATLLGDDAPQDPTARTTRPRSSSSPPPHFAEVGRNVGPRAPSTVRCGPASTALDVVRATIMSTGRREAD